MAGAQALPSSLTDPTIHVTAHNAEGKAIVHSSHKNDWSWYRNNSVGFNVVYTNTFPADLNNLADVKAHEAITAKGTLGLVNPNGTVCRIVDFGPTSTGSTPLMHRTQSLDFGIVLEGEIDMELDDGSVTRLQKGDIAIQRGTMHAWRNPSEQKWTRMLFVLQDCQPMEVGGERLKEDLGSSEDIPRSGNDQN
ncbi:uncharacterized protein AB675_607 [Cyphellophora attinorum]|uniref:Cupin type-2 domain-containing protein n=1 Tax=Cyphellophora attinorum TaxID=1664694 RepID=A0A0N1HXY9_9EURO|nr:uncharacterized protein AB675_607 [Phialophora attinorum]KPI45572.1 hypothetical protein AB675_607 [Phialophora attinorum]